MPAGIELALVRRAIRDEEKLDIGYRDDQGRSSTRVVRPVALIYYSETANLVGWCELRADFRNFRTDRVTQCAATGRFFKGDGDGLRRRWVEGWRVKVE